MPLKTNPVGWFEIPTSDIDRAKRFYEAVFDTELEMHEMPAEDGSMCKMGWFPMQPDQKGCPGTLVQHSHYVPTDNGVTIYFSVEDITATLNRVSANGGEIVIPETAIGEHGYFGWFLDSEGNRVGIHRPAD